MKTIYHFLLLLGLLCSAMGIKAQVVQPLISPGTGSYQFSEYRIVADQTLLALDLGPVRSKVLYDRVFPAAQLSNQILGLCPTDPLQYTRTLCNTKGTSTAIP